MPRPVTGDRSLLVAFLLALGTMLFERGIFFFAAEVFGFGGRQTLALGIGHGVAYVIGAMVLAPRLGGCRLRRSAALVVAAIGAVGLTLVGAGGFAAVAAVLAGVGLLTGVAWPLVGALVLRDQGPGRTLAAIGRFSIAWSLAVPPALLLSGAVLAYAPRRLPLLAAAVLGLAVVCLLLHPRRRARTRAGAAVHRGDPAEAAVVVSPRLVWLGRIGMVQTYSLMFALIPLQPGVFARLGHEPAAAACYAASLDLCRLGAFVAMVLLPGWRGRPGPVLLAAAAAPLGVAAAFAGGSLAVVLLGHALVGAAAGCLYFAPLVHGLLAEPDAVRTGGRHEGAKALALILGPLLGLAGVAGAGVDAPFEPTRFLLWVALPGVLVATGMAVAAWAPAPRGVVAGRSPAP